MKCLIGKYIPVGSEYQIIFCFSALEYSISHLGYEDKIGFNKEITIKVDKVKHICYDSIF